MAVKKLLSDSPPYNGIRMPFILHVHYPAQAASNFRCVSHPDEPVIGHFSASTVNKKRLLFLRSEITGPSSGPYDPTGYEDCESEILKLEDISPETLQGKLVGDR